MAVSKPLRTESASAFKTFVKRSMVTALKAVFTDEYPNKEFRNLQITTEYPQKKIENAFVLVKFNSGRLMNAGVGHEEILMDTNGHWHRYHHSRFEGTLEFHLYTLSMLSQDLLYDSLAEIIRSGTLQNLTDQFYETIFDEYANGGQLMLDTDGIDDLGLSVGPPFWDPEDTLLYMGGMSMVCHGAFFSTGSDVLGDFLRTVTVYPYLEGSDVPVGEITSNVEWAPHAPDAEDTATVSTQALIDGDEDYTPAP